MYRYEISFTIPKPQGRSEVTLLLLNLCEIWESFHYNIALNNCMLDIQSFSVYPINLKGEPYCSLRVIRNHLLTCILLPAWRSTSRSCTPIFIVALSAWLRILTLTTAEFTQGPLCGLGCFALMHLRWSRRHSYRWGRVIQCNAIQTCSQVPVGAGTAHSHWLLQSTEIRYFLDMAKSTPAFHCLKTRV